MHKTIAQNTIYQAIAKGFTAGTGFLITILIARSFGASGYGDYIKITTYIAFFYLAVDLGLNAIYLQLDKESQKFKDFFYARIIFAFLIFLIANLIVFILPYNPIQDTGFSPLVRLGIFIFSFSFFNQAIIFSTAAVFQKKLAYSRYMWAIIFGSIINLILVYLFSVLSSSLLLTIFAFVFSGFSTAFLSISLAGKKLLPISIDVEYTKKILIKAWPISVMLIFNLVYFRADTFLLALFKQSKDVGIYGLSYKFFDFLIALPLFMSNALYPLLLQSRKNFRKFNNLVKIYILVFIVSGIILVIPFWFISPLFVAIKKEYLGAVLPFRILLISLPIFFATSFLQWIFISLEKQKFLMWVYLVAAFLNIILNLIFIPSYTYIASAIITGVSETVVFVVLLVSLSNLKILSERESQR